MNITMLKGKIHRATVVQAELNYVGSITVDPALMEAAEFLNMKKSRSWMWKMEADLRPIP